jgi:hypothetical protein
MDPLRYGAGEAGAFHPLWKLWNNTSKTCLRQRFLFVSPGGNSSRRPAFLRVPACADGARNSSESWGLNSLFGHASLRISLRPVSRPAQEERNECTSLRNLLRIT